MNTTGFFSWTIQVFSWIMGKKINFLFIIHEAKVGFNHDLREIIQLHFKY